MGGGGQTEVKSEAKVSTGKLTPADVVETLSRIPAFCVASDKGELISQTDAAVGGGDQHFVLWYIDADMAKKALEEVPIPGATLKSLPLGFVISVFAGWNDIGCPHEFRVAASEASLSKYEELAPGSLKKVSEEGGWALPLFFDRRLKHAEGELQLFINPEHPPLAWQKRREALDPGSAEAAEELAVEAIDLLELMMRMTGRSHPDDGIDWCSVRLIGSRASLELATSLAPAVGDDDDASEPTAEEFEAKRAAIARKRQICEALNSIPVFTLVAEGGAVLACPDEEGKPFIPWVVDGVKATQMKDSAVAQGNAGIKLFAQPLGDILAILIGWKAQTSKANMRISTYGEAYALLMKSVSGTKQEASLRKREWLVPVFYCADLTVDGKRLVFLHHADLLNAYSRHKKQTKEPQQGAQTASTDGAAGASTDGEASTSTDSGGDGAAEAAADCKIECYELCEMVLAMFAGAPEWQNVQFIGPLNAREVKAVQKRTPGPGEEPPPLDTSDTSNAAALEEPVEPVAAPHGATDEAETAEPAVAPAAVPEERTFYTPNEKAPSKVPYLFLLAFVIGLVAVCASYYLEMEEAVDPEALTTPAPQGEPIVMTAAAPDAETANPAD